MIVKDKGHKYDLSNFEADSVQSLAFIKKEQDPKAPDGTLKTVIVGTTNEEVTKVLIDRLEFLQTKFPCAENQIALGYFKSALRMLEKRTKDRVRRGVEGKHAA